MYLEMRREFVDGTLDTATCPGQRIELAWNIEEELSGRWEEIREE
jgi:hypothetical protein